MKDRIEQEGGELTLEEGVCELRVKGKLAPHQIHHKFEDWISELEALNSYSTSFKFDKQTADKIHTRITNSDHQLVINAKTQTVVTLHPTSRGVFLIQGPIYNVKHFVTIGNTQVSKPLAPVREDF